MRFAKYHALGNDYIVIEPTGSGRSLKPSTVRRICHRHYGIGSDGILYGPLPPVREPFYLRLYNPDGGEFEMSGNGIRIFARYLWDQGLVTDGPFTMETPARAVQGRVLNGGRRIAVEMGKVSFHSQDVPISGPSREVLNETMVVDGRSWSYSAASLGNPHCVLLLGSVSVDEALYWGPRIEIDDRFPRRTNVQFVRVVDRANLQMEIWERGVGYTLASGSSSCAAAAVAHRLDYCDDSVSVHMPGGTLQVTVAEDFSVTLVGPVEKIGEGILADFTQENESRDAQSRG